MSNSIHKRHGDLTPTPVHVAFDEENDGLLPVSVPETKFSPKQNAKSSKKLLPIDRPAFLVLCILYLLQGVPVGLAFGSVPFILKSKVSYSQVGIFSLAAYPYSLKLLWSPIVDSIYSSKVGRRRSWIIPVQAVSGITLIFMGARIDKLVDDPVNNLVTITTCFFLLVLFCATQDIAVDGWALTVLSPECLSFASTAQTIGINCGYFSSFTVFLALSSPDFANRYLRSIPVDRGLFSLGLYLTFWGYAYLVVTALLYYVPEDPPHLKQINQAKLMNEKAKLDTVYNHKSSWSGVLKVYLSMYQVLKLRNVQVYVVILLIAKFGFQVNEAATNLKLLEKGLSKEDLSITVLIDFPFEMIFGYYAGRWSTGKSPLKPWLLGFGGRLLSAAVAQLIIYFFPKDGVTKGYFILIILQHLMASFMSTIQFVSLCAFNTRIADPAIGGTYLTTLNTISNYGGTWPRLLIFYFIDKLTIAKCEPPANSTPSTLAQFGFDPNTEPLKEKCRQLGGQVTILRDGYFYTNFFCISCGVLILLWVKRKLTYLQSLPNSAWRVDTS